MSRLDGRLIAMSVSDAPDRARLGFPQREIDRAVLSLSTSLVRDGADIAYSGNLDPEGYTFKIFRHLAGAYAGGRETPFRHFVPEPVGRVTRYEELYDALREGRGTVRTELARAERFFTARVRQDSIQLDGETRVRNDAELAQWFDEAAPLQVGPAYGAARRIVSNLAAARVVVGGRMGILDIPEDAYQGDFPGIAEEAILTLEAGRPLIALGAFGGASRDIAIALGLLDPRERLPRTAQNPTYALAMERIAALSDRVPPTLRVRLAELAADDRAEQTAYAAVSVIDEWIKLQS